MKSVPGIRLYPSSISVDANGGTPIFMHGTIEEKRSDFDFIFEPLYSSWKDFVFVDDGIFRIWDADLTDEKEGQLSQKFDSYSIEKVADQYGNARHLRRCSVFSEFGRNIYEFEGAGFCLLEAETTLERGLQIENRVWGAGSIEELPNGVICLLQNWDGVFWQIFTNHAEYLKILQRAHAGSKKVPAYWVELSEDFPNPRGSSPDEVGMKRVEPETPQNASPL